MIMDSTTYALGLLVEEPGEVAQMVGKWLRFGPDHKRKSDDMTARRGLSLEVGDMLAAVSYAIAAGVLDPQIVDLQRRRKLTKLLDPNSKDDEGKRLAPAVGAGS